jgi:hypothetical protein
MPLADFASLMLAGFFEGDDLSGALASLCAEAFDFPLPLVQPDPARPGLRALELFHGPTGAFKDFGARFLMGCFDRIGDTRSPLTVLLLPPYARCRSTSPKRDSRFTGSSIFCAEGRSGGGSPITSPTRSTGGHQRRSPQGM